MLQEACDEWRILRGVLIVLGFAAFVALTFAISWKVFENRAERDVSNSYVEDFPVVITTSEGSEVILRSSLETYRTDHPDYSFLVPDGKRDLINQHLRASQRDKRAKGTPVVRVEQLADGKQLIELEVYTEGLFVSRYEASDKEVGPLTIKLAGPLFLIFPCGSTLIVGILGLGLMNLVSLL